MLQNREMEYVIIFEYYDQPLSFIGYFPDELEYYFFYFIDYDYYLMKKLNRHSVDLIFSNLSVKDILLKYHQSGDLMSLRVIDNTISISDIDIDLVDKSLKFEDLLPDEDLFFEEDYITSKSLLEFQNIYKELFKSYYGINNLKFKMKDPNDSNNLSAKIIGKTINLVQNFVDKSKAFLALDGMVFDKDLRINAFSVGSFEIDFSLNSEGVTSLFDNDLDFGLLVNFVNSIGHEKPEYIFDEILNQDITLVKDFAQYFESLKQDDIDIELISNETNVGEIKIDEQLINQVKSLSSYVNSIQNEIKETSLVNFRGSVQSASNKRNSISISTDTEGEITARFESGLFKRIKNLELSVSISRPIEGVFNKTIIYDSLTENYTTKYEITDYNQN